MKQFLSLFLLLPLLITNNQVAFAQQDPKKFRTKGIEIGVGNTFTENITYKMLMIAADVSYSFKKNPVNKVFVAWYCNPQFNIVRATSTPENDWDVETGVNIGIRNYIRINNNFYLYQMLGTGPHFISARLERQARGFLFSDNFALGSFIHLHDKCFLNLRFGIRHISNAELKLPNAGVNSFIVMVGLSGIRNINIKRS